MKLKQLPGYCLLLLLFALAGCKKGSKIKPSNGPDTAIYVIGDSPKGAILWTNGVSQILPTSINSFAVPQAIITSGTDVYIAGYASSPSFFGSAIYWKDGKLTTLTNSTTNAEAHAIAVSGSDVYVAGEITPFSDRQAVYWKNGVVTNLSGSGTFKESGATGIVINGADVYVSGWIIKNNAQSQAVYWKNGVLTEITDGSMATDAFSIAVNNNSVYTLYNLPLGNFEAAYYWKDGVSTPPENQYQFSLLYAVLVNNNNVYLAGSTFSGTQSAVTVWKNGKAQNLPGSYGAFANSITVLGNNIYAAGYDNGPVYWKNNVEVVLPVDANFPAGETAGIAVLAH